MKGLQNILRNNMRKKKILALVGNSGSGKTTLGITLTSLDDRFNWVSSYTTRPKRQNEVNGIDHVFADEKDMPPKKDMVAYTYFGGNHYWTEFSQFDKNKINIYVIDEIGLEEMMLKYHGLFDIKTVYVKREDTSSIDVERTKRDQERKTFPQNFYDLFIVNDYSSSPEFVTDGLKKLRDLCKNWK